MTIRKRGLPPGWYPESPGDVKREVAKWNLVPQKSCEGISAVVPHAGWYYSGRTAMKTLGELPGDCQIVVVAGGHLSRTAPLHMAREDGFEVPGGYLKAHHHLVRHLRKHFSVEEDRYVDNTVEVHLPLIHHLWPEAKIVWLRVPPSSLALEVGETLYDWSRQAGERMVVVGSTDLTHYGRNYGFTPHGLGPEALKWVKEKNDAALVAALMALKGTEALTLAARNHSACSVGAAVTALSFGASSGSTAGKLVEYKTSYDVQPGDSFVGYAGILYCQR